MPSLLLRAGEITFKTERDIYKVLVLLSRPSHLSQYTIRNNLPSQPSMFIMSQFTLVVLLLLLLLLLLPPSLFHINPHTSP